MATEKGLEPSTSGVTGRRSNQLNHAATAPLIYQIKSDLSTTFFGIFYEAVRCKSVLSVPLISDIMNHISPEVLVE